MKNKITFVIFFIVLYPCVIYFSQGCGDSSVQDSGDHINGYITLTDTNLI